VDPRLVTLSVHFSSTENVPFNKR